MKRRNESERPSKVFFSMNVFFFIIHIEGKELPTELRGEAEELKHTIDLEDKQSKNVRVSYSFHSKSCSLDSYG